MPKIIKYEKGDKIKGCILLNEEISENGKRRASFECHCGVVFTCFIYNISSGKRRSCGCAYKRSRKLCNFIHGHAAGSETPEYRSWGAMKSRCLNVENEAYKDYGGRGITICDEWKDSFVAFFKDMGERPSSSHSLERIENDKGYYPGNCKWATKKEQCDNRRNSVRIYYNGQLKNLKQWCDFLGLPYKQIHKRINYFKWTIEEAFETPIVRVVRYLYPKKKTA